MASPHRKMACPAQDRLQQSGTRRPHPARWEWAGGWQQLPGVCLRPMDSVFSWGLTVRPRGKECQELWQQQLSWGPPGAHHHHVFSPVGFCSWVFCTTTGEQPWSGSSQQRMAGSGTRPRAPGRGLRGWGQHGKAAEERSQGSLLVLTHREGLMPQTACEGA